MDLFESNVLEGRVDDDALGVGLALLELLAVLLGLEDPVLLGLVVVVVLSRLPESILVHQVRRFRRASHREALDVDLGDAAVDRLAEADALLGVRHLAVRQALDGDKAAQAVLQTQSHTSRLAHAGARVEMVPHLRQVREVVLQTSDEPFSFTLKLHLQSSIRLLPNEIECLSRLEEVNPV